MGGSSKDTNDAPAKDSIGLFRLQDLEAMEVDEPELFPASPPPARRTPTDPFQTESVVAAIRRARRQDSGDFESTGLDTSPGRDQPDVADLDLGGERGDPEGGELAVARSDDAQPLEVEPIDLVEELPDTPRSLPLTSARTPERAEIPPVPVEATGAAVAEREAVERLEPVSPAQEVPRYGTGEAKAVIAAAAEGYRQRSHLGTALTVGIPLLLLGATVLVVLVVLRSQPQMLDVRFPVVAPETVAQRSDLVEIEVALIPPPPEVDEETPGADDDRRRRRHHDDDASDRRRRSPRRDRADDQLQDLDLGF